MWDSSVYCTLVLGGRMLKYHRRGNDDSATAGADAVTS